MDDPRRILDFWHTVELISPQSIPKPDERSSIAPVFHWRWQDRDREPLSWDPRHPLGSRVKKTWQSWRHTVFAGVFEIKRWQDLLEERLGRSEEAIDTMLGGHSCLFTLTLSDEGRSIPESFCPSAAAWAFGRTVGRPGPSGKAWLDGFPEFEEELIEKFDRKIQVQEVEVERVVRDRSSKPWRAASQVMTGQIGEYVDPEKLGRMLKWAIGQLGVETLIEDNEFRIESRLIDNKDYFEAGDNSGLLNSFFIEDLERLRKARGRRKLGQQLSMYLGAEVDQSAKKDLVGNPEHAFEQLDPSRFPKGRWPIAGHYPLVASQQVAVNAAFQALRERDGVFSVNGPPGTGKTTLLRDLIAGILVDRADKLVELEEASDAFIGKARWKTGDFTRVASKFQPYLVGDEIVIASSNNGAVENISLEIPELSAVDEDFVAGSDPFQPFASRLLKRDAWALLAGRLGNRGNCYQFCSHLIDKSGRKARAGEPDPATTLPGMGLREFLRSQQGQEQDWETAKQKYRSAVTAEQKIRARRSQWAQSFEQLSAIQRRLDELELSLESLEQDLREANQLQEEMKRELERAEGRCSRALGDHREHRELRPGFWQILISRGKDFVAWRTRERELSEIYDAHVDAKRERAESLEAQELEVEWKSTAVESTRHEVSQCRSSESHHRQMLQEARDALGAHFPDRENWQGEGNATGRELSSPWSDREWMDARTRVFIEAIHLHRAFVLANADRFRMSLDAVADILRGTVPADAPAEATRAAWQALFFVVPVISTTFASVSRLFRNLSREDLGWLLIDEAGQATPQAAVGALWRTRRSVVVGDPQQLEPIVTLPFRLEARLLERAKLSETWLPSRTSVQTLADRLNSLGTELPTQDDSVWIGCPLRVHRRCDNPMFEISNRIAYDNLMVKPPETRSELPLPESQWIHVSSLEVDGHWLPEEGRVATSFLLHLESFRDPRGDDEEPERLYLLSPFRKVVANLRAEIRKSTGRQSPFDLQVGTVHTAQGKESNIVVLVLGGDPSKPGAKAWAASKPNLLNVAVSRAKRRLYVIGNHDAWSSHPYFETLAAYLPRETWQ